MKRIDMLDPACQGMSLPLDWRGLAFVLVVHLAAALALLNLRPTVQKTALTPPIFADIIVPERGEPIAPDPEPQPPAIEPPPPSPPPPRPTPRKPDPAPQLAAPATAPTPAEHTVAPAEIEPGPETPAPAPEAAAAPAPSAPARTSLDSLPGSPDDVRKYIAAVMRQLQRHKTYPRALKKAKIEGTVVVQFRIDRDGHLLTSDVKQSSGHPELDRAAMDMLVRAEPLPAIPDFMNRDELALAIPVEYSLITDR
jgi:protein TonB